MTYQYAINHDTYDVSISLETYIANGQNALRLLEEPHKSEFMIPSVCLIDEILEPDEIAIKTWGGQEEVLPFLVHHNIISSPIRYTISGHVDIPICKLYLQKDGTIVNPMVL